MKPQRSFQIAVRGQQCGSHRVANFQLVLIMSFFLVLACCPAYSQDAAVEKATIFGCEDGAVTTDIDREPALKFVPVDEVPIDIYPDATRKFDINYEGHTYAVQFLLSATLPEEPIGRGSRANLTLFARRAPDNSSSAGEQTWQLVSTATGRKRKTSNTFAFDATKIAGCVSPDENTSCKFANIGWATRDGTPIFQLSFTEDQGGANANNWQNASILLDFRSSAPRVLASADCAYNEGGGVCTAIDSGEASRSGIECTWNAIKNDFGCSETMSDNSAHRDFFLLGDVEAPLQQDEVATIADAVAKLKADSKVKVSVRNVGLMHLVTQVQQTPNTILYVLCASTIEGGIRFFLVSQKDGKLQSAINMDPRSLFKQNNSQESGDGNKPPEAKWTVDRQIALHSKTLYEDPSLAVLQIVSGPISTEQAVYWVGLSKKDAAYDAVVVSGDDVLDYIGCGRFQTSPSVVKELRIDKPFHASVEIQPTTIVSDSDNQPITWDTNENGEPVQNCLRQAEIRWTGKQFAGSIDEKPCREFDDPRFMKIDEAGNVTLSKDQTP